MIKVILLDTTTGKALNTIKDTFDIPTIAVTDNYLQNVCFKSSTRTSAGTTIIASPKEDGAILITDMIISTDRVANSQLTVFFDDGTYNISIYDGYANDAPLNLALGFHGGWIGWKDASLEMTTVAAIKATVAVGYMKIPKGREYEEWNALR